MRTFQSIYTTFKDFSWKKNYEEWGKVFYTEKYNLGFQFECGWGRRSCLEQQTESIQEYQRCPKGTEEWNIPKEIHNGYRRWVHRKELIGGGNGSIWRKKKRKKKIAVCTLSFKFHFPDYCIQEGTERLYQMNIKYAVTRSKCPAQSVNTDWAGQQ